MDFMLKFSPVKNETTIQYQNKIMLLGSCFTEHIGNFLTEHKWNVLQNPNGILFDTLSVCRTLSGYMENTLPGENDLFQYNELWHSWQHHSKFSGVNKAVVLEKMLQQQKEAAAFLQKANWLIITLGSSFAYQLNPLTAKEYAIDDFVVNCHKAPLQWFNKYLIPIEEQIAGLTQVVTSIRKINPGIKIIFTVSPVRHIRDGVVENNRSKARLIEVVHHLCNCLTGVFYFAAYELLIDVLRDYRFYDIDMVHPNYSATNYVIDQFSKSFLDDASLNLLEKIKPIIIAKKHKAFNPESIAHKKFLTQNLAAIQKLKDEYPFLNFDNEIAEFTRVFI